MIEREGKMAVSLGLFLSFLFFFFFNSTAMRSARSVSLRYIRGERKAFPTYFMGRKITRNGHVKRVRRNYEDLSRPGSVLRRCRDDR